MLSAPIVPRRRLAEGTLTTRIIGIVLVTLLVAGPRLAAAQGADGASAPNPAPAGSLANPSSQSRDEASQLTPRQMVDRAERYIDAMRQRLKEVLKILANARQEKDVVKLNCVNEKVTQVKGLVRVSEQSSINLQEDVAKQEIDDARHEYLKIAIAREKVQQLRAEAEQCIGQLAFVVDQNTVVKVTVPENLPQEQPQVPEVPPVVVRPPPASPVQ